ncbi:MAG TPA: hypothetical protein VJ183_18500 [Chloroflexia bacterium]|nr:hypothetical protein [Chloroflexia bacterium]
MGIDFEMAMAVFLKDDIKPEVLAAFQFMVSQNGNAKEEPPPNPFPKEDFLGYYNNEILVRWFSSYEPSTNHPESISGLRLRDPEGYLYGGGATEFPGEYGAILRKVYRYNLPANQGLHQSTPGW